MTQTDDRMPEFPGEHLRECGGYRRALPHWRLAGATYFVTWRVFPGQADLHGAERSLVAGALRHFNGTRYDLYAFVVMNDHVHVLASPRAGWELEQLTHSWKSFTAYRMRRGTAGAAARVGHVWQDEPFDRIVRSEEEFYEKVFYILNNPVRRWPEVRGYEWVWVCDRLVGELGLGRVAGGERQGGGGDSAGGAAAERT